MRKDDVICDKINFKTVIHSLKNKYIKKHLITKI